jgi:hypothetical protein
LEGFNEFLHVNNVFSSVGTRAALSRRAQFELGQEIRSQAFFAFKLRNGNATIELDRVVLDPRAEKEEGREIKRIVSKTEPTDEMKSIP